MVEFRLTGIDVTVPPWPLLTEVADATPDRSWVLVGGMMTQLHALRGRVNASRPTTDVDLLINLEAIAAQIGAVAGPLQRIGLQPVHPQGSFHRFIRDRDIVDIMVSRSAPGARWARHPVMRAPGASLALHQHDAYIIEIDGRADVRIHVPTSAAAMVLKAAAYVDDRRDQGRHLEDLVILLAADTRPEPDYSDIPKSQRRHLEPALAQLANPDHQAWLILDPHDRQLARRAFDELVLISPGR